MSMPLPLVTGKVLPETVKLPKEAVRPETVSSKPYVDVDVDAVAGGLEGVAGDGHVGKGDAGRPA